VLGLHASQRLLQPRFIQPTQQLDSENTGEWRASFAVHRSFQQQQLPRTPATLR
jgi:hypothetical protein